MFFLGLRPLLLGLSSTIYCVSLVEHPVFIPILYPREMQFMWPHTVKQINPEQKNRGKKMKYQRTLYECQSKKQPNKEIT